MHRNPFYSANLTSYARIQSQNDLRGQKPKVKFVARVHPKIPKWGQLDLPPGEVCLSAEEPRLEVPEHVVAGRYPGRRRGTGTDKPGESRRVRGDVAANCGKGTTLVIGASST